MYLGLTQFKYYMTLHWLFEIQQKSNMRTAPDIVI